MENTLYKVYCVKKIDAYKLIIILNENSTIIGKNGDLITLRNIISETKRKPAVSKLTWFLGFWAGKCKKKNIKINEIDLILPPLVDYIFLQEGLRYNLLHDYNITLTITSGLQICNDYIEAGIPSENEENLERLVKTNSGLN